MSTPGDPTDPQNGNPPEYPEPAPGGDGGSGDGGSGDGGSGDGGSGDAGKRSRAGLFAGGGIAAVAVIVAVVFAVLYGTGTAPFDDDDGGDSSVEAITHAYVDAFNSQKVDDLRAAICSDDAGQLSGLEDGPGSTNPITVDKVSDVQIDGDTATAQVTASAKTSTGEPDQQTLTLAYKKDGGRWTVCPSLNPANQDGAGTGQGDAGTGDTGAGTGQGDAGTGGAGAGAGQGGTGQGE